MAESRFRLTGPGMRYESTSVNANWCNRNCTISSGQSLRGLEPDRGAVAAMGELALQRTAQVVDLFFVDKQVAVARDPELVAAQHLDACKQFLYKCMHND